MPHSKINRLQLKTSFRRSWSQNNVKNLRLIEGRGEGFETGQLARIVSIQKGERLHEISGSGSWKPEAPWRRFHTSIQHATVPKKRKRSLGKKAKTRTEMKVIFHNKKSLGIGFSHRCDLNSCFFYWYVHVEDVTWLESVKLSFR